MTTRIRVRTGLLILILGLSSWAHARADALYQVTDLGAADSSANYLNLLGSVDQESFRAGSFDSFAHPATVFNLPDFVGGDVSTSWSYNWAVFNNVVMYESNNQGVNVGVAQGQLGGGIPTPEIVIFWPNPHTISDPSGYRPSVQSPGYLNQVGYPLGFLGTVNGINDQQAIVGESQNNPHAYMQPILVSNSASAYNLNLGNLGGENGVANALNNLNQVVGWSQIADGTHHAFLYSRGTMTDLNALIPATSGFTLTDAVGIDAQGRIAVFGTDINGQTHELLLTPTALGTPNAVPEPSALAVLGLGCAAFAFRLSRRYPRHRRA